MELQYCSRLIALDFIRKREEELAGYKELQANVELAHRIVMPYPISPPSYKIQCSLA